MNITQLFQRRKALQAELVRPLHKQRLDILRALAIGATEIDEAGIFEVIDALKISETQFYKDLKIQESRFEEAEKAKQHKQALRDIEQLTAEASKLAAERQAFLAKLEPKQNAVSEKLRAAELVILQTMHAESKLIETCLDTELIERTKELEEQRYKVGMQARDLQQEASRCQQRITYARAMLDSTKIENDRLPKAFGEQGQEVRDNYKAHQLKLAKEKLAAEERAAAPVFDRVKELTAQQQKLDAELRELNRLKLVP